MTYWYDNLEDLFVIPGHKLLRPGNDPVVSEIPEEVRIGLLKLDPFYRADVVELFINGYTELGTIFYARKDPAQHPAPPDSRISLT